MFHLIFAFLISSSALGDSYFTTTRFDETVPAHCENVKINSFIGAPEKFYVGRKGARKMGFTFEYPIERDDAKTLWRYFKKLAYGEVDYALKKKILSEPKLKRDYDIVIKNFEEQGFDFGSEGEILEILAIEQLYREFPENHYFISGAVNYHQEYSPTIVGEIDVYVAERETCRKVAIGEVKLGRKKTLNKARQQLTRLSQFLRKYQGEGLGGTYDPIVVRQLGAPQFLSAKDYQD